MSIGLWNFLQNHSANSRAHSLENNIPSAKAYETALDEYVRSPIGKRETMLRLSLRKKYLRSEICKACIIAHACGLGVSLDCLHHFSLMLNNWHSQIRHKRLTKKHPPSVTQNEFLRAAKEYIFKLNEACLLDAYDQVIAKHKAFKIEIMDFLEYKHSPEELYAKLQQSGVKNPSVLEKPFYWSNKYKKKIERSIQAREQFLNNFSLSRGLP